MSIKKKVLQTLENNKGLPISGETLAGNLQVSRNSIWKAINSLRKEGYAIEARSGLGYLLDLESDLLSPEGISGYLWEKTPLDVRTTVDSTNTVATSLAMGGSPNNTVVIAGQQTMGRGRRGRNFYSPSDTGLYMSFILRPSFTPGSPVLITAAAAVATAQAIDVVCGIKSTIKWVNDIYIDGKKVSGILTEALTNMETGQLGHIILGIGVNCFTDDFPVEAGDVAGSIAPGNPKAFSRNKLAAEIINRVLDLGPNPDPLRFMDYYRNNSMVIGKSINVYPSGTSQSYAAKVLDIDDQGGLVILKDGQRQVLHSGEITIRIEEQ